jgi:transcription factor S
MLFCPKCGSLMKPFEDKKGRVLKCPNCNHINKKKEEVKLTETSKESAKIDVIEETPQIYSKVLEECPKCKNKECEYWLRQMRGADEAPTKFFRCLKCKYTWKDEDR